MAIVTTNLETHVQSDIDALTGAEAPKDILKVAVEAKGLSLNTANLETAINTAIAATDINTSENDLLALNAARIALDTGSAGGTINNDIVTLPIKSGETLVVGQPAYFDAVSKSLVAKDYDKDVLVQYDVDTKNDTKGKGFLLGADGRFLVLAYMKANSAATTEHTMIAHIKDRVTGEVREKAYTFASFSNVTTYHFNPAAIAQNADGSKVAMMIVPSHTSYSYVTPLVFFAPDSDINNIRINGYTDDTKSIARTGGFYANDIYQGSQPMHLKFTSNDEIIVAYPYNGAHTQTRLLLITDTGNRPAVYVQVFNGRFSSQSVYSESLLVLPSGNALTLNYDKTVNLIENTGVALTYKATSVDAAGGTNTHTSLFSVGNKFYALGSSTGYELVLHEITVDETNWTVSVSAVATETSPTNYTYWSILRQTESEIIFFNHFDNDNYDSSGLYIPIVGGVLDYNNKIFFKTTESNRDLVPKIFLNGLVSGGQQEAVFARVGSFNVSGSIVSTASWDIFLERIGLPRTHTEKIYSIGEIVKVDSNEALVIPSLDTNFITVDDALSIPNDARDLIVLDATTVCQKAHIDDAHFWVRKFGLGDSGAASLADNAKGAYTLGTAALSSHNNLHHHFYSHTSAYAVEAYLLSDNIPCFEGQLLYGCMVLQMKLYANADVRAYYNTDSHPVNFFILNGDY